MKLVFSALMGLLILGGSAQATTVTFTSNATFTGGPGMSVNVPDTNSTMGVNFNANNLTGNSYNIMPGTWQFIQLGSLSINEVGDYVSATETDNLGPVSFGWTMNIGAAQLTATSVTGYQGPVNDPAPELVATFNTSQTLNFGNGGVARVYIYDGASILSGNSLEIGGMTSQEWLRWCQENNVRPEDVFAKIWVQTDPRPEDTPNGQVPEPSSGMLALSAGGCVGITLFIRQRRKQQRQRR